MGRWVVFILCVFSCRIFVWLVVCRFVCCWGWVIWDVGSWCLVFCLWFLWGSWICLDCWCWWVISIVGNVVIWLVIGVCVCGCFLGFGCWWWIVFMWVDGCLWVWRWLVWMGCLYCWIVGLGSCVFFCVLVLVCGRRNWWCCLLLVCIVCCFICWFVCWVYDWKCMSCSCLVLWLVVGCSFWWRFMCWFCCCCWILV